MRQLGQFILVLKTYLRSLTTRIVGNRWAIFYIFIQYIYNKKYIIFLYLSFEMQVVNHLCVLNQFSERLFYSYLGRLFRWHCNNTSFSTTRGCSKLVFSTILSKTSKGDRKFQILVGHSKRQLLFWVLMNVYIIYRDTRSYRKRKLVRQSLHRHSHRTPFIPFFQPC